MDDEKLSLQRLQHIDDWIRNFDDRVLVRNLTNRTGDQKACAQMLAPIWEARAMSAWFKDRDIGAMRNCWYVAGMLNKLAYGLSTPSTLGPVGNFLELRAPLLSGNDDLITWYVMYKNNFDVKRAEDHRTLDFFAFQSILALRGDWVRIISRCEKIFEDPPKGKEVAQYILDYEFYFALARRDVGDVNLALQKLSSAPLLKSRKKLESGFTADLISTPAVIYAWLAWKNGLEVNCNSPYVPLAWFQDASVVTYDEIYGFLS